MAQCLKASFLRLFKRPPLSPRSRAICTSLTMATAKIGGRSASFLFRFGALIAACKLVEHATRVQMRRSQETARSISPHPPTLIFQQARNGQEASPYFLPPPISLSPSHPKHNASQQRIMSYAGVLNAGAEVDKVRCPGLHLSYSLLFIIITVIIASPNLAQTLFYAHFGRA